jgi:hypothetical protein
MEDTIRNLQREFDQAELAGDTDTLNTLIADDFLSIGPKGFVMDRSAWVGRHVHFTYQELVASEVDVRLYPGTAIVRNVQANKATYQDRHVQITTRVSQVWINQQGHWRLAAIQFSPLG